MPLRALAHPLMLPGPIKRGIFAAGLGAIGILAIMLSTAYSVRKHVALASGSVFPAALESQRAGTAFERMNRDYGDAILMQDETDIASSARESSTVISSLDNAAKFMHFDAERQRRILSLRRRVVDLQKRSMVDYEAARKFNPISPIEEELADLAGEKRAVQAEMEALQNDLAGDFRAELALIDTLLKIQGVLQALVLAAAIVALFFGIRSLLDNTLRRREDEMLRATHQVQDDERNMLRALIDNIPDFIYVKDIEGRFLVANTHLARVVGASAPEEVLGKTDFDYYPEEMARCFDEDEKNVIRSGQPLYDREEKGVDRAGGDIQVLTTKVPVRDHQGNVIGIAGIGRDITARKEMERALMEAERNYRGIFDKAIVGIFQSTPEGSFLSVNPSMAFTLGYDSPEEMITSVTDILSQLFVDHKRGVEFMLVMDRVGGVKNFECEAFRKDGSRVWLTMSIRAIRQRGVVVRYEGMCEDISERNQLREQLFQAQKLESVGQLAAGIAHEINTPTQYIGDNVRFLKDSFHELKSLLGNYERLLLAAKANTLSAETVQEVAEQAEHADTGYLLEEIPKAIDQTLEGVTRVAALVNAMKEFSHPGTKEKVPVDLNRAIASTITVARNEWKYVADLDTEFDPTLPPVSCLPGEFNQVVLNLIVNSAHAVAEAAQKGRAEKGKIKIQTRNYPNWVEVRVEDNGDGIPEVARSRIFDPFFTTKEVGKGTGQGLAIARSVIVDKHGGSIRFESEEGKGTAFIIRLPFDGKALGREAAA